MEGLPRHALGSERAAYPRAYRTFVLVSSGTIIVGRVPLALRRTKGGLRSREGEDALSYDEMGPGGHVPNGEAG